MIVIQMVLDYYRSYFDAWKKPYVQPIGRSCYDSGPSYPFNLMPICVFNFLSALSVSFRFRFEHSARAALPGAGFLLAGECLARFLPAADEFFAAIKLSNTTIWIRQFRGAHACVRVSKSIWSASSSCSRPRSSGLYDGVVDSALSSCRLLAKIRWGHEG